MADGLDEHLALVRIADQEGFDIVQLQNSLTQFLANKPKVECKKGVVQANLSLNYLGTPD